MASSKTLLETYCKEHHLQLPVYSTERGESSCGYTSSVLVCDRNYHSLAIHSSTKLSEEDAARVAYSSLRRASESAASRSSKSSLTGPRSGTAFSTSSSSSAQRTGLATRSACQENGSANADYSQKLEKLCNARGLPAPEYAVRASPDGKFGATVIVGKEEYLSNASESYTQAKEYASLIALAEVGLSLLNINEREDGTEDNLEKNDPVSRDDNPPHNVYPELPEKNYKAILNEYCQKNYLPSPEYETDYPEDSAGFVSVLHVCGKEYRSRPMAAKKKAEQNAAGKAALDIGLVKIYRDGPRSSVGTSPVNGGLCTGGVGLVDRFAVNGSATSSLLGGGGVTGSASGRFSARSAAVPEDITSNYKGMLQEFLAKRGISTPQYNTQQGGGGRFVSTVTLTDISGETMHFQGKGYANKKTAEQSAAKQACIHYGLE